jgi:hypothetical protein
MNYLNPAVSIIADELLLGGILFSLDGNTVDMYDDGCSNSNLIQVDYHLV